MAYTKTVWVNDEKPAINADNLNKIEQGIEDVQTAVSTETTNRQAADTQITGRVSTLQTTIGTLGDSISTLNTEMTSTVKTVTLAVASWTSGSYTITDDLITETSNQEVIPAMGITPDQYSALCAAQIVDGGQTTGSLTLKALGTVPTIDIPIRIIYRGVK